MATPEGDAWGKRSLSCLLWRSSSRFPTQLRDSILCHFLGLYTRTIMFVMELGERKARRKEEKKPKKRQNNVLIILQGWTEVLSWISLGCFIHCDSYFFDSSSIITLLIIAIHCFSIPDNKTVTQPLSVLLSLSVKARKRRDKMSYTVL